MLSFFIEYCIQNNKKGEGEENILHVNFKNFPRKQLFSS